MCPPPRSRRLSGVRLTALQTQRQRQVLSRLDVARVDLQRPAKLGNRLIEVPLRGQSEPKEGVRDRIVGVLLQDLPGMRRGLSRLSCLQESPRQVSARVDSVRVGVDRVLKTDDRLVEATRCRECNSEISLAASARRTGREERLILDDRFRKTLLHQQDIAQVA